MGKRVITLIVFYMAILVPFYLLLRYMKEVPLLYGWGGIGVFLAYCLLYRPYLDYLRLKQKGIVTESFKWGRAMNYNYRYFKEIFWL